MQRRKATLVHILGARLLNHLAFPLIDLAVIVQARVLRREELHHVGLALRGGPHQADCPPQFSFALMSAPAASSTFAASSLPLRAAAISGVSPSVVRKLGSAPALSSASRIGAEPMIAASVMAEVPNWFASLTFAPRFDQRADQFQIAIRRRVHDGRAAVGARGVHVGAFRARQPHGGDVVAGFQRAASGVDLGGQRQRRAGHQRMQTAATILAHGLDS